MIQIKYILIFALSIFINCTLGAQKLYKLNEDKDWAYKTLFEIPTVTNIIETNII